MNKVIYAQEVEVKCTSNDRVVSAEFDNFRLN